MASELQIREAILRFRQEEKEKNAREDLYRDIARCSARCHKAVALGFSLGKPAGDVGELAGDDVEPTNEESAVNRRNSGWAGQALESLVEVYGDSPEHLVRLLLLRLELVEARLNLLDSILDVSHRDWSLLELSEYLKVGA